MTANVGSPLPRVAIKARDTTMSTEKPTNEPKPKTADDLLKTTKDNKVELNEEELKRVSGGGIVIKKY
jgi:hypothetical protein